MRGARCGLALVLAACASPLPTEAPPLLDMEEPLLLFQEPQDEAARRALPAGGFTGVTVGDARRTLDEQAENPLGVLVLTVADNSPAAQAGIEPDDLLLRVLRDGQPAAELRWPSQWRELELHARPGERLQLELDRAGTRRTVAVTVASRMQPAPRDATARLREEQRVGLVLRTATEVEARAADLAPGAGAVVVGLSRGSPWRTPGIRFGDLITHLGEQPLADPQQLLAAIASAPGDGTLELRLRRDGQPVAVRVPVSRRTGELTEFSIPVLFSFERERDRVDWSLLLGFLGYESTRAAWGLRLLWLIKLRGGDADRLEEVKG